MAACDPRHKSRFHHRDTESQGKQVRKPLMPFGFIRTFTSDSLCGSVVRGPWGEKTRPSVISHYPSVQLPAKTATSGVQREGYAARKRLISMVGQDRKSVV